MFASHRRISDAARTLITNPALGIWLLLTLLCASTVAFQAESAKPAEPKLGEIELVLDFGNGFEKRYFGIPHRDNMTVGDAMQFAGSHRHPTEFEIRGKGATALLIAVDGQKNEGGNGLNWVFRVNGKLGARSLGVTPLQPGDRVLWKFDKYK